MIVVAGCSQEGTRRNNRRMFVCLGCVCDIKKILQVTVLNTRTKSLEREKGSGTELVGRLTCG